MNTSIIITVVLVLLVRGMILGSVFGRRYGAVRVIVEVGPD
jgi:hypothetical protein